MVLFNKKPSNPKIPDNGPIYLTPDGILNLKKKLAGLEKSIPELAQEAGRTASYGDRSDNAEYKEAKRRLRGSQGQILKIKNQLKRAVIISSDSNKNGYVQIGSTITVQNKSGLNKTYRILGPEETNPEGGCISFKSPLGAALLNHMKGDVVEVSLPNGIEIYTILDIK